MKRLFLLVFFMLPLLGTAGFFHFSSANAQSFDWDSIPGKDIVLFYPGQASWEWVLTQSSHSGAKKFREGKNCRGCHEGEEMQMGDLIVSGKKLEPEPIERKRGSIPVNVKFGHDGARMYIRLEWTEQGANGFPKLDPDYEAKVTVMMDDGSVVEATRAGCWGACHDDAHGMASAQTGQYIKKYLARSRKKITRQGGGLNFKSDSEITALAASGGFLEYWQAKLNHDADAVPKGGYILKAREEKTTTSVTAEASYNHGNWVVVLSRPLDPGGDFSKAIVPGKIYSFGIAIHEAHSGRRYHHVSFEHTFVLDQGEADFIAPSR